MPRGNSQFQKVTYCMVPVIFSKGQNSKDGQQISGCQGIGNRGLEWVAFCTVVVVTQICMWQSCTEWHKHTETNEYV